MENKYVMRIVEGSLLDPSFFGRFSPKILSYLNDPQWGNLFEVSVTISEVKEIQKQMVRHYEDPAPWYMDGWLEGDRNKVICAFGADDGEGGRIFTFDRGDTKAFSEVTNYALSKGIPKEQIDFLD